MSLKIVDKSPVQTPLEEFGIRLGKLDKNVLTSNLASLNQGDRKLTSLALKVLGSSNEISSSDWGLLEAKFDRLKYIVSILTTKEGKVGRLQAISNFFNRIISRLVLGKNYIQSSELSNGIKSFKNSQYVDDLKHKYSPKETLQGDSDISKKIESIRSECASLEAKLKMLKDIESKISELNHNITKASEASSTLIKGGEEYVSVPDYSGACADHTEKLTQPDYFEDHSRYVKAASTNVRELEGLLDGATKQKHIEESEQKILMQVLKASKDHLEVADHMGEFKKQPKDRSRVFKTNAAIVESFKDLAVSLLDSSIRIFSERIETYNKEEIENITKLENIERFRNIGNEINKLSGNVSTLSAEVDKHSERLAEIAKTIESTSVEILDLERLKISEKLSDKSEKFKTITLIDDDLSDCKSDLEGAKANYKATKMELVKAKDELEKAKVTLIRAEIHKKILFPSE